VIRLLKKYIHLKTKYPLVNERHRKRDGIYEKGLNLERERIMIGASCKKWRRKCIFST